MKKIYKDQSGASAIMFTMFFIIVISLLTIGFALLAQKDQRSTLDKTLSLQAEYAAESGVNAVRNYIEQNPSLSNRDNCSSTPLPSGFIQPLFSSNVSVTCYTWKNGTNRVVIDGLNFGSPEWIPFNPAGPVGSIRITWTGSGNLDSSTCNSNSINGIRNGDFPSLRLITSNLNSTNINYLCARQSAAATSNGNNDGGIAVANCNSVNKSCTATINAPIITGYLAIAQLQQGNVETVTIEAFNGGAAVELTGVYEIDVTAKSQDIIKRSFSTIAPGGGTSWSPGQFVVGSNSNLCKNYKVGSTANASTPSASPGPLCPTN